MKKDKKVSFSSIVKNSIDTFKEPPLDALVCDAGCVSKDGLGTFGQMEYSVYYARENRTIETKSLGLGTCNAAEFIALVRSVQLAKTMGVPYVFSESTVAIWWFTIGEVRTGTPSTALDWAIETMKELKADGSLPQVFFWRSAEWGKNPANIGRKGIERRNKTINEIKAEIAARTPNELLKDVAFILERYGFGEKKKEALLDYIKNYF